MIIARRTTALALTEVANSASVLRIHMELILLTIAYLASETHMENLFNFTVTLDKLNMPCSLDTLVIDYFVYPSAGLRLCLCRGGCNDDLIDFPEFTQPVLLTVAIIILFF